MLCLAMPGWAQSNRSSSFGEVDLSKYSDNMTVLCQVKQGSNIVIDCELAAFDDKGELRGKVFSHPEANGLIFLTIQGEGNGATQLHFKVALGNGNTMDIKEVLVFSANQVVGSIETPQTFTASGQIKGDVNGDGDVTIADLSDLIQIILDKIPSEVADIDGNGKIDLADVMALRKLILKQ